MPDEDHAVAGAHVVPDMDGLGPGGHSSCDRGELNAEERDRRNPAAHTAEVALRPLWRFL
ncbi:UNVERIFIED_CONTAM: hypothetical protein RF648_10385 [Kocuria sp. CPCC 205274]